MKTLNQCKIEIAKKYNLAYYGDADVYERANKLADEVAELYASEFNKPPVYGWGYIQTHWQRDDDFDLWTVGYFDDKGAWTPKHDFGTLEEAKEFWKSLPPSPGSVDVEVRNVKINPL